MSMNIDPKQTQEAATFQHDLPLTTCRISPDGEYVFAGAEDLHVHRWKVKSGDKSTLSGHASWVRSMDFSADSHHLLTAGWDGRVGWWEAAASNPQPIRMLDAHDGWVRCVRARQDGKLIATCGNDHLVKVWDGDQMEPVWQFARHKRHVYSVDFHPDGRHLVSGDLMGGLHVWDLQTGKHVRSLDASVMTGYDKKFAADMGGARDMRFNADGSLLACAGITNVRNAFAGVQSALVLLVDWQTGKPVGQLTDGDYQGISWGVRFHKGDFIVAVAANRGGQGVLWFFHPDETKPFHSVKLKACGRGLDITQDQTVLATAQSDGALRLYNMIASQ